jgi:hypothetical protein
VGAAFVAIVLSPFVPAGVPVLAAGLTAVAVGWGRADRLDRPDRPERPEQPLEEPA